MFSSNRFLLLSFHGKKRLRWSLMSAGFSIVAASSILFTTVDRHHGSTNPSPWVLGWHLLGDSIDAIFPWKNYPKPVHYITNQSWQQSSSQLHLEEKYEVIRVIGQGGFGQVYYGRHKASNLPVAIKNISKQHTSKEKFLQEVNVLEVVGGKNNILELYDAYETQENYVLVTEFVEGQELYDKLIQSGTCSEAHAKELVKELCNTISYLHRKKIAHADIKPENILLSYETNQFLRLIDFGVAFHIDNDIERQRSIVGGSTMAYSAPEFIKQEKAGCAVDTWALGVVLYVLLCGYHPFDMSNDATDEDIKQRILSGNFAMGSLAWENVTSSAKDLIQQMLSVDPLQRISVEAVLDHQWFKEE